MTFPFLILSLQTLILWLLVVFFHRAKSRITLIPLYSFLAILTFLTHNLSDLGYSVIFHQLYFLIASISFFTSLMLGILFIYLFEGPRATRVALYVVLFISLFYIGTIGLLGLQADTSHWIMITPDRLRTYFFSLGAITIDVFLLPVLWEALGKIHKIPLFLRVFVVMFTVLAVDTIIFSTGVFSSKSIYISVLTGNLIVRLILSLIISPLASYFLSTEGFEEEKRSKPKTILEIFNFKSDLELKIKTMEESIQQQKVLEAELKRSQEQYRLALTGANAGIWD